MADAAWPDHAFPITLYVLPPEETAFALAEAVEKYFRHHPRFPFVSDVLLAEGEDAHRFRWICRAVSDIRHESIAEFQQKSLEDGSAPIQEIEAWLDSLGQDGADDEMTKRLRNISTGIENLIGSLNAAIAEIEKLEGDVAERDLDIEQLRAQVATLQAELRRKKYSTKRILAIVSTTAVVVGALSTTAQAVEGSHHTPALAPVNITNIIQDCDALQRAVESAPRTVPIQARGGAAAGGRAEIRTTSAAEIRSDTTLFPPRVDQRSKDSPYPSVDRFTK